MSYYGVCMCVGGPPPGGVCRACGMAGVGYGFTPAAAPMIPLPVIQRAPVLCPVCKGKQRVSADFYPVGQGESGLNAEFVTCRSCGGRGMV